MLGIVSRRLLQCPSVLLVAFQVSSVACATEHAGKLWMGNLAGNYVSVLDLAAVDASTTTRAAQPSKAAGTAGSGGAAN